MNLGRIIRMGMLHTRGDFWVNRSKVKVTVHYTKNLEVGHNFVQPSWISLKLGKVIPMGMLPTRGDFWVKFQGHSALYKKC